MRMRDLPLVGEAERDLKAMFVQELAADHIPEATEHVPMRVPRDSRPSVRQGGGAECVCVCVCVCVGGLGGTRATLTIAFPGPRAQRSFRLSQRPNEPEG